MPSPCQLQFRTFSPEHLSEALNFTAVNPWKPRWPQEQIRRFLTLLTSSPEFVFDLHGRVGREGLAVLLDKVQNPGNKANLEILGVSPECEVVTLIDKVLDRAKDRLPTSFSGFQIGLHGTLGLPDAFLLRHQLEPYYVTIDMQVDLQNSNPQDRPLNQRRGQVQPPAHDQRQGKDVKSIRVASPEDQAEVYSLLVESFKENVETSVPRFEEWRASSRTNASVTWLAEDEGRIVGFLTLFISPSDKRAEIGTVGVLRNWRGRGWGKFLIERSLHHLHTVGVSSCALTVAVQNINALQLYRGLGFQEIDRYQVYKWER
ncbi:MAG: GNAT family N-acetyltransferase [Bdellovibrionales bacterium]